MEITELKTQDTRNTNGLKWNTFSIELIGHPPTYFMEKVRCMLDNESRENCLHLGSKN